MIATANFADGQITGGLLMEVLAGEGDAAWIGAGDVASFTAASTAE